MNKVEIKDMRGEVIYSHEQENNSVNIAKEIELSAASFCYAGLFGVVHNNETRTPDRDNNFRRVTKQKLIKTQDTYA